MVNTYIQRIFIFFFFNLICWRLGATWCVVNFLFPFLQFKIALCQLLVTTDKSRNIFHAREAIEEAANKGAQLVLLPVSILTVVGFWVVQDDLYIGSQEVSGFLHRKLDFSAIRYCCKLFYICLNFVFYVARILVFMSDMVSCLNVSLVPNGLFGVHTLVKVLRIRHVYSM